MTEDREEKSDEIHSYSVPHEKQPGSEQPADHNLYANVELADVLIREVLLNQKYSLRSANVVLDETRFVQT